MVLAQLHRLKMEVSFSEADIGKVREGQTATVSVDSMEGTELAGEVTKVSVLPSEGSSQRRRIPGDDPPHPERQGRPRRHVGERRSGRRTGEERGHGAERSDLLARQQQDRDGRRRRQGRDEDHQHRPGRRRKHRGHQWAEGGRKAGPARNDGGHRRSRRRRRQRNRCLPRRWRGSLLRRRRGRFTPPSGGAFPGGAP